MNTESPVQAVQRVLRRYDDLIPVSNALASEIVDAVRSSLPVPTTVSVVAINAVLRSLSSGFVLDQWADRSACKVTELLSKTNEFKRMLEAGGVDDEAFWCHLEGLIAGLLLRVVHGEDL